MTINQRNLQAMGKKKYIYIYIRNEIPNNYNKWRNWKNVEQQINHGNSWKETPYSRENKHEADINIGTAIHLFIFF